MALASASRSGPERRRRPYVGRSFATGVRSAYRTRRTGRPSPAVRTPGIPPAALPRAAGSAPHRSLAPSASVWRSSLSHAAVSIAPSSYCARAHGSVRPCRPTPIPFDGSPTHQRLSSSFIDLRGAIPSLHARRRRHIRPTPSHRRRQLPPPSSGAGSISSWLLSPSISADD